MHVQTIVALFVCITFVPQETDTCAATGICGANPMCGGGLAPIPPSMPSSYCGHSCGPGGYGCGPYGCYRTRARASTNYQPYRGRNTNTIQRAMEALKLKSSNRYDDKDYGDSEPLQELDDFSDLAAASPSLAQFRRISNNTIDPNRAFRECCLDRKLPDACLEKCHFAIYNKEALQRMYFKQDGCPLDAMREIQFCAAQGQDHRECCIRNGITTTLAGQKCLVFCDQRPGKVTQLDLSYLPCFDRFESMKSCFWHEIVRFYRKA